MSDAPHWCKSVIDTVVTPISNLNSAPRYSVPPPMPPVKSVAKTHSQVSDLDLKVQELLNNNRAPAAAPSAVSDSQYLQMYQQYYNPAPVQRNPQDANIPSPAQSSQYAVGMQQPLSYKSVLSLHQPTGGPSAGWSMQNLPRATGMPQQPYGVTATATSYEALRTRSMQSMPNLPSQPPPPNGDISQTGEKRKKSNRFSPIDAPNAYANQTFNSYTNPTNTTSVGAVEWAYQQTQQRQQRQQQQQPPSTVDTNKSPYQFTAAEVMSNGSSKAGSVYGPGASTIAAASGRSISNTSPRSNNNTPRQQPTSLKDFVKRAFASCTSDPERNFVNVTLQKLIARVTADGRLNVHKWELEAIPLMPSVATTASTINTTATVTALTSVASSSSDSREYKQRIDYIRREAEREEDSSTPSSKKRKKNRFTEAFSSAEVRESPYSPRDSSSSSSAKVTKSVLAGVDTLNADKSELQMRQKRANRFQSSAEDEAPQMIYFQDADVNVNHSKKAKNTNGNGRKMKVHIPSSTTSYQTSNDASGEFDMDRLKIVGTSAKLEKPYLRLTSAPHHSAVRPEAVLRKSIQLLKKKWSAEQVDYEYMCSQLKAIRQDLTVQHITNDFTVHVYETHARVALESEDMNEYNQCQTQLKQLYASGLKGCEMEFTAYRILYYVYLLGNKKHTGGSSDLTALLNSLPVAARKDSAVSHALTIRQAIQLDNYHRFFKLYNQTPNMGHYILDKIIDNYRLQTLQKIVKAYKPTVPASFVAAELAFDDVDHGVDVMKKCGCKFDSLPATPGDGSKDGMVLEMNTKNSVIDFTVVLTQDKLLL